MELHVLTIQRESDCDIFSFWSLIFMNIKFLTFCFIFLSVSTLIYNILLLSGWLVDLLS